MDPLSLRSGPLVACKVRRRPSDSVTASSTVTTWPSTITCRSWAMTSRAVSGARKAVSSRPRMSAASRPARTLKAGFTST
jgi:hypothetical protein